MCRTGRKEIKGRGNIKKINMSFKGNLDNPE
jgi:hypothetical protein